MRVRKKDLALTVVLAIALALPAAADAQRNLYIANFGAATITAYDVNGSNGAIIQSGSPYAAAGPAGSQRGLAISPDGTRLYVANLGTSDSVSGYTRDVSTGVLTPTSPATFATGNDPSDIAFNPTGTRLYVTSFTGGTITAYSIDPSTGALTSIDSESTGAAQLGVAINPAGTRLYVANNGSASISGFNINPDGTLTAMGPPSPFPTGTTPHGIAINPAGTRLYNANDGTGDVRLHNIDPTTGALTPSGGTSYGAGTNSEGVVMNPAGTRLYVSNTGSDNVSAYNVDASSGALTAINLAIPAGNGAQGIAMSPGRWLYVTNVLPPSSVSAYDVSASTGALGQISGSPFTITNGTAPSYQSIAVTPNQSPTANFTSTPAAAGSESVFNASSSSDDGGIATYKWNFGDSTTTTTTSLVSVAHTYSQAGTYNVTLTVDDGEGCPGYVWAGWTASCLGSSTATKTSTVTISAAPSGGGGAGSVTLGAIKSGESALTATLTCTGGPCTGKVSVLTKRKYSYGKKRRGKRRAKKKQLVLGSKTFSLNADQKSEARIVYSKKTLKQLKKLVLKGPFKRKGRKVPVLIRVVSGGKTTTRTEAIKFKGKKKKRR